MTQPKIVLDTNAGIFLTMHSDVDVPLKQMLDTADVFVSLITRMELLSKPGMEAGESQAIMDFLSRVVVASVEKAIMAADYSS